MFLGSAQGAVDSLLGFLLQVAEATGGSGEEDHGVRAWMKQVAEVAYASQNCVDLYARCNGMGTAAGDGQGGCGMLFFLRRLPRLLWTVPTRHRIAVQIRELKVRSREVGERRLRYGVEAPPISSSRGARQSSLAGDDDDGTSTEQEDARRRALAEAEPAPFESFSLVRWMTEDRGQQQATPRVIALVGSMGLQDEALRFAKAAYLDPWVASSCSLNCMAMIQATAGECTPAQFLRDTLAQLDEPPAPAESAASILEPELEEGGSMSASSWRGFAGVCKVESTLPVSTWTRLSPWSPTTPATRARILSLS